MKTFLAWFALSLTCGAGGIAQDRLPTELRTLFDYDTKVLLDEQSREIATVNGVRLFEISYASPKGGRVPAYLVVPAGKGFFPAILYGPWGYGTRTEFLSEALLYAEAGVVSLLVDYPWVRPLPWRKNAGDSGLPEPPFALQLPLRVAYLACQWEEATWINAHGGQKSYL